MSIHHSAGASLSTSPSRDSSPSPRLRPTVPRVSPNWICTAGGFPTGFLATLHPLDVDRAVSSLSISLHRAPSLLLPVPLSLPLPPVSPLLPFASGRRRPWFFPNLVGLRKVRSKAGSASAVGFRRAFLHPCTHSTWVEPFPLSPPHLSELHLSCCRFFSLHLFLLPGAIRRICTAGGFLAAILAALTSPSSLCRTVGSTLSTSPSPSSLSPAPGSALSTSLSHESSPSLHLWPTIPVVSPKLVGLRNRCCEISCVLLPLSYSCSCSPIGTRR
uniref:Uncharacterized protein n=1 Tax=Ananas comosus var. bracteatus TaxID=296719 RepID=A0A6V7QKK1_ANACO|nr:unnamed protein product [Ananas comosus var. bracteatus]